MYGLKTRYDEIFATLEAMRKGPYTDSKGRAWKTARDISLREYISENFETPNKESLSVDHFLHELGVDEFHTTANDLYGQGRGELVAEYVREGIRRGMGLHYRDAVEKFRKAVRSFAITGEQSGGERWVTPEFFLDPVMRGAIQANFYADLVIREIMVSQPTATVPKVELSDASPRKKRTEGATRTVGTVTYGSKQVTLQEFEKGIEITDEAIMFNTLDFISIYFEDLGGMLGADLNNECVYVLINGDQADGSEAAAVIGVEDTAAGIQYLDILRIWVRMSIMNRRSTSIIGNETTLVEYLDLPEVKNKNQIGAALLQTNVKTPLPTDQDAYASVEVPADSLAFEDNSKTLVQLTAKALMIESERSVKKSLNGSYARIWSGFSNLQRNSRVVLDASKDFATYPFPSWMAAYTGQAV
jgi:hypothetical protein